MDKVLEDIRTKFDARLPAFSRCGLYGSIIQALGAEQFTWKGLPVTSHFIERAVNSGLAVAYNLPVGISAVNKGFQITACEFIGTLKNDGTSDKVIATGSDYAVEIDLNKDDAVIIKNNEYMYSEYVNMLWFADMLARTDESEKALIIWSKMHPIPKATSGIEVEKLKTVLKDIAEKDCLYNVISDDTKILTGQPMSRDDAVLRLTDENAVEKMHFLSEYHYELIRRYCTLYNIPFRTTAKSAQNLESELHNTDIFSQMFNANRLKCRKEAIEKINAVFGFNASVDFSEFIKKENEVIDANIEEEKEPDSDAGATVPEEPTVSDTDAEKDEEE